MHSAGLAAWIIEKFRTWSDCHGDLDRSYTKDELLTNICIYWFASNSCTRLLHVRSIPACTVHNVVRQNAAGTAGAQELTGIFAANGKSVSIAESIMNLLGKALNKVNILYKHHIIE